MEAASAFFDAVSPRNPWENGGLREKRRGERKARVPKGGGGVTWSRRISTETVAATADTGEKSGQPGGVIWRGEKGEMERRMRGLIGTVRRRNGSGVNRY
jgi:hypothetical protein